MNLSNIAVAHAPYGNQENNKSNFLVLMKSEKETDFEIILSLYFFGQPEFELFDPMESIGWITL